MFFFSWWCYTVVLLWFGVMLIHQHIYTPFFSSLFFFSFFSWFLIFFFFKFNFFFFPDFAKFFPTINKITQWKLILREGKAYKSVDPILCHITTILWCVRAAWTAKLSLSYISYLLTHIQTDFPSSPCPTWPHSKI